MLHMSLFSVYASAACVIGDAWAPAARAANPARSKTSGAPVLKGRCQDTEMNMDSAEPNSAQRREQPAVVSHFDSKAKVDQLEIRGRLSRHKHKVLSLEVTMNNSARVQKCNRIQDLAEDGSGLLLAEGPLRLDSVKELACTPAQRQSYTCYFGTPPRMSSVTM